MGTIIQGKYKIKKFLMKNKICSVYLVQDVKFNKTLIMKSIIYKQQYNYQTIKQQLLSLQKLQHQNILPLLDIFEDQQISKRTICIVHPYSSINLKNYLNQSQLQYEKILDYGIQILKALNYFHSNKIVYLNLKPQKILLFNDEKNIKLDLLQIQRFIQKQCIVQNDIQENSQVSQNQYYMDPQIIQGVFDPYCDIWSFGIILTEMLLRQNIEPIIKEQIQQKSLKQIILGQAKRIKQKQFIPLVLACFDEGSQKRIEAKKLLQNFKQLKTKQKKLLDMSKVLTNLDPKIRLQNTALGSISVNPLNKNVKLLRDLLIKLNVTQEMQILINQQIPNYNKKSFLIQIQNFFNLTYRNFILYYTAKSDEINGWWKISDEYINLKQIIWFWKNRKFPLQTESLLIIIDGGYSSDFIKELRNYPIGSISMMCGKINKETESQFENYIFSLNLCKRLLMKTDFQLLQSRQNFMQAYSPNTHFSQLGIYFDDWKTLIKQKKVEFRSQGKYFGKFNQKNKYHEIGSLHYKNGDLYDGQWQNGIKQGKAIKYYSEGHKYDGEYKKDHKDGKGIYYYANGGKYEGDWSMGKKEGKGAQYYIDNSVYQGQWKLNMKEGKGMYISFDGNKYQGQWRKNKMQGKGILQLKNGSKYEGQWKNNQANGKGIFFYSNGQKFIGDWENDKKNGHGTFYYLDGSKFQGMWKEDIKQGNGVYTLRNGNRYEGEWKNNQYNYQKTTFSTNTGQKYVGQWKDQKPHGNGILYYKNGDRFEGNFRDGMIQQRGVLYYGAGGKYSGQWKQGKKQGSGMEFMADGSIYTGKFHNNQKHGFGIFKYKNGNRYEGQYVKGLRQGKGTMSYADGGKYVGQWKNDKKQGDGTYIFLNDDKYEGQWLNDKMNGKGTYYFKDKSIYKGDWKDDKKQGFGIFQYNNGNKYIGNWKNNMKQGQGVLYFKTGQKYDGDWKQNKKFGTGKFYSKNGQLYEGQWKYSGGQATYDDFNNNCEIM